MKSALALTATIFLSTLMAHDVDAQNARLRDEIARITASVSADVGVAVLNMDTGDTLTLHGRGHFPMQSVFKFPLAIMVLHEVDKGTLALDQKIHLRKEDMLLNTWSPMAEKYPEGNVDLALSEILRYTVSQSDNSGCDVLFRLMGGPKKVNDFLRGLGITQITIAATETEMHQAWPVQFTNWCEPVAMVALLKQFDRGNILSPTSREFLWKIMVETSTGPKRIKGLLPEGTVVAHKTGTGDYNAEGVLGAMNDAGIIVLPGGSHVAVVVYISQTKEKDIPRLELVIAQISRVVYDQYTKQ
ncbi:class A beta-lactamase, subclass A2 [Chryseolinea soli]|uniref:beta-lactamase n=1 Tax=Chryseolinea soli TaxID=2321403 RepID=A0A385SJC6_9BACT|nr:class A beta-lactamase, subclass A2 [Chryseolinea soli]AYB31853.1 class A beta-lactamase, subclass A2 [Chryseolinea soli]